MLKMYQGMPNQPQNYRGTYYPQADPYVAQYQRLTPVEPIQSMYNPTPASSYLKGRPVLSIEEAKASQIDLDGSLHVFTDIGNKKIYTKQLNLDGTATLNTYVLMEGEDANNNSSVFSSNDYVTKAEFNQALTQIQNMFVKKEEEKKPVNLNF